MTTSINLQSALANSYKNFHARGFDYLCLSRTPDLVRKVYFFGDIAPDASEIVNPHDHRYNFSTEVLAGSVINQIYRTCSAGQRGARRYTRWQYRTPLNGGSGFRFDDVYPLLMVNAHCYAEGERYNLSGDQIHTIAVKRDTVLLLEQGPDQPLDCTFTYTPRERMPDHPPEMTGLYERFTADEIRERVRWLNQLGFEAALVGE